MAQQVKSTAVKAKKNSIPGTHIVWETTVSFSDL